MTATNICSFDRTHTACNARGIKDQRIAWSGLFTTHWFCLLRESISQLWMIRSGGALTYHAAAAQTLLFVEVTWVLAAAAGPCASQPASLAGAAHRSPASAPKMHCNCKIIGGGLALWVPGRALGTPLLSPVSCPCSRLDRDSLALICHSNSVGSPVATTNSPLFLVCWWHP